MQHLILPFLQIDINEKIKNAPNGDYQIGIVIGTYLPVILLILLAWLIYWKAKNRKDLDN